MMKHIKIKRTLYIEYKYPFPDAEKTPATKTFAGTYVQVRASVYVSTQKPVLLQCICKDWKQYFQRSEDNGKTWQCCGDWYHDDGWYRPDAWDPDYEKSSIRQDKIIINSEPNFFLDPDENLLLRIYSQGEHYPKNSIWNGSSPFFQTNKIMCQVSRDEGFTWSEPQQVIQKGQEYNEEHWGRDFYRGKQGGLVEGTPFIKLDNDEICVPFTRMFSKGKHIVEEAACLLGRWNQDKTGLDWELSEYVSIDPKLSAGGADEPSVAKLNDGRLFMIMRASKSKITNLPSLKYYAISDNNGRTWSQAKVITYPDGSVIYSPSCLPNAFCSSKNGRLYIITTLLNQAPFGSCDPRYPLQIAEVDQKTFGVIPETITVIEDRKPEQGEPENIRFSNWRWHEDRETKDIVLFMTACPGNDRRTPDCGCPMHSYRYDIHLPEI